VLTQMIAKLDTRVAVMEGAGGKFYPGPDYEKQ
jgi:hypothetical protein